MNSQAPDVQAQKLVDLGSAARQRRDHTAALGHFMAAADLRPGNPGLQLEIATTLLALKRLSEAAAYCDRVLQKAPHHDRAMLVAGLIAREKGDHPAALAHLEAAGALKPHNLVYRIEAAQTLRSLGRLEEAKDSCRQILEKEQHHFRALVLLGTIECELKDYSAALRQFRLAAEADPQNVDIKHRTAIALRELGRRDEAVNTCRAILSQDPRNARAVLLLTQLLHQGGDEEGALTELNSFDVRVPANEQIRIEIARSLTRLKRYDEATSIYRSILDSSPLNGGAVIGLAGIARATLDWPSALMYFRRAADQDPNNPKIGLEIASVLDELYRSDEAKDVVRRCDENPAARDDAGYQIRKFQYYCDTLQLDKAESTLRYWPSCHDFPDAYLGLIARLYAERGQWDAITALLREWVAANGWPARPDSRELLLEAIAAATRRKSQYEEIYFLVDHLHGSESSGRIRDFQDQIIEEFLLFQSLDLVRGFSQGVPLMSGVSEFRRERQELYARILGDRGPDQRFSNRHPAAINPICGATPTRPPATSCKERAIYYCTDSTYLLGTAVSLFSLLRRNTGITRETDVMVYCSSEAMGLALPVFDAISAGLQAPILIRDTAEFVPQGREFRTTLGGLTAGVRLSDAAYYRIYAALDLLREKSRRRALYIDADTCVGADLDALLEFDLDGMPIGARLEPLGQRTVARAIVRLGLEPGKYFNSGVLLFDLSHGELETGLKQSIEISINQHHLLLNNDQSAINIAFKGRMASLPAGANAYVRYHEDVIDGPDNPFVMHFLTHPKPWDPWYRKPYWRPWFNEFVPLSEFLGPQLVKALLRRNFEQATR